MKISRPIFIELIQGGNMAQQFNTGDTVQLKSGGPKMTVKVFLENANQYRCQWFAGSKLEEGLFPPESLQVPPPPGRPL